MSVFGYLVNTPGTSGGPGGRDRTLAMKRRINAPKFFFWCCKYLLVMPNYQGKQIFTHGRFPEVGQKQKTEREKKEKKREKDRTMVKTMAKLRMAHASTHGARKPSGPKIPIYGE